MSGTDWVKFNESMKRVEREYRKKALMVFLNRLTRAGWMAWAVYLGVVGISAHPYLAPLGVLLALYVSQKPQMQD